MMREPHKRPRRIPRTSEEVNYFIKLRKRREYIELHKLKGSWVFKFLNIWNILCIFIYVELIFCYLGPCQYQTHYSSQIVARLGNEHMDRGKTSIAELDIYAVNGELYTLVVEDFVIVPPKFSAFKIGKDFLLQKELKGMISTSDKAFRLFSASPVLFLSLFLTLISFVAYQFNLNENFYSLCGLCSLNTLTLISINLF